MVEGKASRRDAATVASVASAGLALILRMSNGGWLLIIFGLGYVLLCVVHVLLHRRAAAASTRWTWPLLTALAASNLALLCAFVLQWDTDDAAYTRLTLTANYDPINSPGPPAWLDQRSDLAILVPIASWPLLFAATRSGIVAVAAAAISAALALALCGVVGATVAFVASESAGRPVTLVDFAGGATPADCGPADPGLLAPPAPAPADGSGTRPVWILHADPDLVLRAHDLAIPDLGSAIRDRNGRVSMTWFVAATFDDPVTVRMTERSTGKPVQLSTGDDKDTQLTLGAAHLRFQRPDVAGVPSSYPGYVVYVYPQRAGCYDLDASWPGGSWRLPIAAGQSLR